SLHVKGKRIPYTNAVEGESILNHEWIEKLPVDGIRDIIPAAGGDVNDAYRVETDDEPKFLLVQPGRNEAFYAAEIAGLEAFEEAGITAPQVLGSGESDGDAWLLLTYLAEVSGSRNVLGKNVAKVECELQTVGKVGFDQHNQGGAISF